MSTGISLEYNPRAVVADKNPLDKSTIFSIYEKDIPLQKLTIFPANYVIKGGTREKPGRTVIGGASWWKPVYSTNGDEDQLIEVYTSSIAVSKALIEDHIISIFQATLGLSGPGLFRIDGDISLEKAQKEYAPLFDLAHKQQTKWFENLIAEADMLWARTNGNPKAIGDDMRMAAHALGQKSKPWLNHYQATELVACIACGAMRNPAFPVCQTCKAVVDVKKAEELKLSFAK